MKDYIIFYQHKEYGYYSTTESAKTILQALEFFIATYSYVKVYGIMEKP